ncbi:ADP-ribosylation factor 1-like 2 [Bolinopsis microptera]|uniref:ADP-ribosylation factor 1-like 2 n=1 Tax=Bolinopsis microptera TaxID=2820187 RepID=UPI00307A883B
MGGSLKKLSTNGGLGLFRKNSRIVMLGLDAAGKTTILYKLKLDETVSTIPTIGFNVETVKHSKSVSFTVWDIGGQQKLRPLWKHYLKGTDGLIFVVDCWDFTRVDEVREELSNLLALPEMQDVPIMIFGNKQDMRGAVNPPQLIEQLHMNRYNNHSWYVQGTCAVTGEGIWEGIEIIAEMIKDHKRDKRRKKKK